MKVRAGKVFRMLGIGRADESRFIPGTRCDCEPVDHSVETGENPRDMVSAVVDDVAADRGLDNEDAPSEAFWLILSRRLGEFGLEMSCGLSSYLRPARFFGEMLRIC